MKRFQTSLRLVPLALFAAFALAACEGEKGDQGDTGPPGAGSDPPTPTTVAPGQPGPGIDANITAITGGTGPNGSFLVGDQLTVTFTLAHDDGTLWSLSEMVQGRITVAGPTFNYQRVIAELSDVVTRGVEVQRGTYRYTFQGGLPATFLPPINDGPDYGPDDGELAGQPLLDGTYTVTMAFRWSYTVSGNSFNEDTNAHGDFPVGNAGPLSSREVVRTDGCNQCHDQLRFHGGRRRTVTSCLMCHTAGMESSAAPNSVLGRQEHLSFQSMVHRIHSGQSLPSVQGVTTLASGDRDYTVTAATYNYEDVKWPQWPSLASPMPRDSGFTTLSTTDQAKEDAIRKGPVSCAACHGDPDGNGPLEPPAQGDLIYVQPSRGSCASCHDDWIPSLPYTANMQTMPAQTNDATCVLCHPATGSNIAIMDAHVHPLVDTAFAEGIVFEITNVVEASGNMNGTIEPGEVIEAQVTMRDSSGADIDPLSIGAISVAVHGPTENSQLLLSGSFPNGRFTGAQPYTTRLPETVYYEYVGDGTGASGNLMTARAPHWALTGAETEVYVRTASSSMTVLSAAALSHVNFIDVASSSGFARGDFVVIDPGTVARECLEIQWVDGDRLWFSSPVSPAYAPGPTLNHAPGATVREVTLTLQVEGVDYTLDDITGTITGTFQSGAPVFVRYVTDYRIPAVYPVAINAGPDLGPQSGGWTGFNVIDGTYTIAMWAARSVPLGLFGETTVYSETSTDAAVDFQIGVTTSPSPYGLIESPEGCNRCHVDIEFHGGGRRGFKTCIACHGNAASADRPRYVAANAPDTDGVLVDFRVLIHTIHQGADLEQPHVVVGFGLNYPNNFSVNSYEEIEFPALPSGTKACTVCHGDGNTAWKEASSRDHPMQQTTPSQPWSIVCSACHDSTAAQAHIEANTSPVSGAESCIICHGEGRFSPIDRNHMIR